MLKGSYSLNQGISYLSEYLKETSGIAQLLNISQPNQEKIKLLSDELTLPQILSRMAYLFRKMEATGGKNCGYLY